MTTPTNTYPDFIRGLPEVDVPFPGVKGWLLQSGDTQVVFFDIEPVGDVPPHAHCAQWGLMVEGEMRLTIGEDTRTYRKGDHYFIPEGVTHGASFNSHVQVIDVFDAPDRYKPKWPPQQIVGRQHPNSTAFQAGELRIKPNSTIQ